MADILEKAKEINKRIKEGKILGMTKDEADTKLAEIKKEKIKSGIKKAVSTAVSTSPIGAAVKSTAKGAQWMWKHGIPKDIKRDIKKRLKKSTGGGVALRGLGRAFQKGGKV